MKFDDLGAVEIQDQPTPVAGTPVQEKQGFLQKIADIFRNRQKLSKQGLTQLAEMIPSPEPTGKEGAISKAARVAFPTSLGLVPEGMLGDLARGTPRIGAETIAEYAPSYLSLPSLATYGAGKGLAAAKPLVKGVAKVMSMGSGAKAENLVKAFEESPSFFTANEKNAGAALGAARSANLGENVLSGIHDPKAYVNAAEKVAKFGKLSPGEAGRAKVELGKFFGSNTFTDQRFRELHDLFSSVEKSAPELTQLNKASQTAHAMDEIRDILPVGNMARGRMAIGSMGMYAAPWPAKPLVAAAVSPAVQGGIMTTLGALAKHPSTSTALSNVLQNLLKQYRAKQ